MDRGVKEKTMPGYLELLRQARVKAGEVLPPTAPEEGGKLRKFVNSYTPSLQTSPLQRLDNKTKLSNDINDICFSEQEKREDPYEVTNFTKFGNPLAYSAAFEALLEHCPEGVFNFRYMQAVTDAEHFLATWGGQAEAFGWTVDDLFGLHPTAPMQRYDVMGLIWFLQGRSAIALTERTAVFGDESQSLSFYRRTADFPWRRKRG
jgi:hypothetical protein